MLPPLHWPSDVVSGFSALANGSLSEAASFWLKGRAALICGENSGSPCLAFVQNNIGVAFLLQGEIDNAEAAFDEAFLHWSASRIEFGKVDVEAAAASSAHQLRLALDHAPTFAAAHRRRLFTSLEAGTAIARSNRSLARGDASPVSSADADAIDRALGPESMSGRVARAHLHGTRLGGAEAMLRGLSHFAADVLRQAVPSDFGMRLERAVDLSILAHKDLMTLSPARPHTLETSQTMREA